MIKIKSTVENQTDSMGKEGRELSKERSGVPTTQNKFIIAL